MFANLEIKLCGRPTQVLFLINFDDGTCEHRVFSDERISYNTEITNFDDKFEDEVLGWCMMYFCKITYQQNYVQFIRQPETVLHQNTLLPVDNNMNISVQRNLIENFDNVTWTTPPSNLNDTFYNGLAVNLNHLMHFQINRFPGRMVHTGGLNLDVKKTKREQNIRK